MIPITKVELGTEEEDLVLEVIRSGQLAQGEYVERFEQQFAEIHGVKHALAVNNGTTALVVALEALGIGPGDEVITTPFTFVATLNAILESGATARFADIGEDFNVVPAAMEALINDRTRALLPVHLYGYPADMTSLMTVAAASGLDVIEDSAQAVGATIDGGAVGSFGVGTFSLYATKNLTTGEGGVVTTNDDGVADRIRLLRNQGMRQRYQYEVPGHNYRLTNVAAAIGLPQLTRLADMTAKRVANADALREGLAGLNGLALPPLPRPGTTHVYHQFTIRITEEASLGRDAFVAALNERGIGAGVYYPARVFDYDCYRSDSRVVIDDVPIAAQIAGEVVSLPVHPYLTSEEIDIVVRTIHEVLGQ